MSAAALAEGEPSSSEVQPARSAQVVSPTSSPHSSCGETRTYLSGSLWKRLIRAAHKGPTLIMLMSGRSIAIESTRDRIYKRHPHRPCVGYFI